MFCRIFHWVANIVLRYLNISYSTPVDLLSLVSMGSHAAAKAAGMEGIESIAKTLAAEPADMWMELQYFRDHNQCKEVYAKMMKDKSIEPLGIEFFGLIAKGKNLITGGFSRLR